MLENCPEYCYTGVIKYIINENNIQKRKQGDLCDYYYVKMI